MSLDHSAPIIFLHFPSTLMLLCSTCAGGHALINGEYPWTYDNDLFGGELGALQSPINIDPTKLIFDPQLGRLRISQTHLEAHLWNMGQFPLLTVNNTSKGVGVKQEQPVLNIDGGPAHPYTYQLQQTVVHFGDVRKGERGSEHTVDRVRFPAEVQLLAFNSDLYDNFTHAQSEPKGLLGIAIIIDIGDRSNPELHRLTQAAKHIKHRNQMVRIKRFQPVGLVPPTEHYVTYEGSLTYPGCFETVTCMSPTLMETTNLRSAAKQHCSETNLHVREDFVGLRDNGFKILEKCCSVELSPARVMIPPSRLARTKEMPNIADIDDNEYISEGN
ncbi:hypothetical protein GPALN_001847 [Globodera pallida]|nr:hypothetical protein GPALN_001847 [Globodera pallida]